MASSVPWEWTQLKTEYGFLQFRDQSAASCQGQGVSEQPPDSQPWFCAWPKTLRQVLNYQGSVVKLGSYFDIEVAKEFKECGKNITQNRI